MRINARQQEEGKTLVFFGTAMKTLLCAFINCEIENPKILICNSFHIHTLCIMYNVVLIIIYYWDNYSLFTMISDSHHFWRCSRWCREPTTDKMKFIRPHCANALCKLLVIQEIFSLMTIVTSQRASELHTLVHILRQFFTLNLTHHIELDTAEKRESVVWIINIPLNWS